MLPFVVFQFHLIFVLISGSHGEKRLLLNDPDYAARIQQLEVTVQTLVSEMTSVKQQKVTTESKLLEANTKISQLQSALNSRTRTYILIFFLYPLKFICSFNFRIEVVVRLPIK